METRKMINVKKYILKRKEEQLKRAAEIEKLKNISSLTSGVIHDLNNILTTITGYMDIILSRDIDEKTKSEIMIIKKSAEDGAQITKRIKNYGIQDNGDKNIFDINDSIEYAVLITKPIWHNNEGLSERDIQVRFARTEPIMVSGNEKELRETFVNMIINSVDAIIEKGSIEITLSKEDNRAIVNIMDNGQGIPESIKCKIFNPFFSTKKGRGSGLGLSLAYNTITAMDGRIAVESQEGRGTRFIISLPVENLKNTQTEVHKEKVIKYCPEILVVDDQFQICSVIKEMLQRIIDGEVETSVSSEDALCRIKEKKFDIIISDISMPGIGGKELISHIRKLDSNILVVAMSGWTGNLERKNNLGADYLLSKPFTIEDLQIMLLKLYKSKNNLIV